MNKENEFIRIIKENESIIFKITTIYTDNKEDQQDLYQDIVYQLWKSFDSFRNESKFSTWMYRIALNTALTRIKKKKKGSYSTLLTGKGGSLGSPDIERKSILGG